MRKGEQRLREAVREGGYMRGEENDEESRKGEERRSKAERRRGEENDIEAKIGEERRK